MNNIPIPQEAVDLIEKGRARKELERMQLENVLLKHLIATIDPLHDYVFDAEKMSLYKVRKPEAEDGKVSLGAGQGDPGDGPEDNSKERGAGDDYPFRGFVKAIGEEG